MREFSGAMTSESMREIIFDDHSTSRFSFAEAFPEGVSAAIAALADSYRAFQSLHLESSESNRSAVAFGFLHLANNSLVSALYLLMSGFMAPAGNLMRHYSEATAMSLLCAERSNGTFEKYSRQGFDYPVQRAVDRLGQRKIAKAVGIDPVAWAHFKQLSSFYDQHSHASDMAIAANIIFDRPGFVVLGGQFDPGKLEQYRIELERIRSAAIVLGSTQSLVKRHLDMAKQAS